MVNINLIGVGKMGLSHLSILNANPSVQVTGICDNSHFIPSLIEKATNLRVFSDPKRMMEICKPDAIFIATPSHTHAELVELAIVNNIHVFCEKPFCTDVKKGARLVQLAEERKLVNQVGYHCRFISAFEFAATIVKSGALGEVYHATAEVNGPVILAPNGNSWRSKQEGGGCLYDYACHGIDLLNSFMGQPESVSGSVLRRIHSSIVEDEVHSNLHYTGDKSATISANWSDPSFRKMSTRVVLWGKRGKIIVDRQEIQLFLHEKASIEQIEYPAGWTLLNNQDLKVRVNFYLRGEEYSSQIDHFLAQVENHQISDKSNFRAANQTDQVAQLIIEDAQKKIQSLRQKPSTGHGRTASVTSVNL